MLTLMFCLQIGQSTSNSNQQEDGARDGPPAHTGEGVEVYEKGFPPLMNDDAPTATLSFVLSSFIDHRNTPFSSPSHPFLSSFGCVSISCHVRFRRNAN